MKKGNEKTSPFSIRPLGGVPDI